jgi:predicted alpha/beta-fold hydrolase
MRRARPGLLVLVLLGTGCTLHPLPTPVVAACPAPDVAHLWNCISDIPRPATMESGFRSTVRAASIVRKSKDQDAGSACDGDTPPGFTRKDIAVDSEHPPLHALFFAPPAESRPIVIVVHGLFDSKLSRYVWITADLLRREGFGVLAPDMRWHGCLLARAWLPTLGIREGGDLVAWAAWLRREHPGHPIGLVGFSIGGLAVLHALGEPEAADVFDAGVIAVSPAAALPRTAAALDSKAFFLDAGFTSVLRWSFRHYLRLRLKPLSVPERGGVFASFLQWLAGQNPLGSGVTGLTVEEFLKLADPAPMVAASRRPVLILTTDNDPILSMAGSTELSLAARQNGYARVIETPFGGHIGQAGLYPEWMSALLATFFRLAPAVPPAPVPAPAPPGN